MFLDRLTQLLNNAFRPKPKYITVSPVASSGPLAALPPARMPRHVAIIMDGNGRWATQRGLPRSAGHASGTEALRDIIRASDDWGIEALSLYAFSTENWARSKEEVDALMGLLLQFFASEIDELDAKHVRILIMGDVDGLPPAQRKAVCDAMERTKDNTGLKLNIALNYGGRAELTRAARILAQQVLDGELMPADIDEDTFAAQLYAADSPDVDLLIRTSGEQRISNFLPWQLSYAEFIFDTILWPDFTRERYMKCLREYAGRDRRFGAETSNEAPAKAEAAPAAAAPAEDAPAEADDGVVLDVSPVTGSAGEDADEIEDAIEEAEEIEVREADRPQAEAPADANPPETEGEIEDAPVPDEPAEEAAEAVGDTSEEGLDAEIPADADAAPAIPDEEEAPETLVLNITPVIFPKDNEPAGDTRDRRIEE